MKYSYAIIGDVTCDLSPELQERFELDGFNSGHITLPNGKETRTSMVWDFMSAQEFYSTVKSKKDAFKTAPASMEEIITHWETFMEKGQDLLAISISGALSVTYNLMINAKKALESRYPERKIEVIDSRKYSVALGLLVIQACLLRKQGVSLEENAAQLEQIKHTIHQMGTVDDLFFIASKGRLSHSKAFMGTLAGVKPVGDFDADGMVTVLAKLKGYDKVYKTTIEYIKQTIVQPENQIIIVAQTMREKQANTLIDLIKEHIRPKEVILSDIYPANGVNIGPGLMAAYYLGTPITDLENEKRIMKSITESV